jgi:hypothetical protein
MRVLAYTFGAIILLVSAAAADGPAALSVSVQQLIENPAKFNGNQVSVIAYYASEHHGPYLCADAKTARQGGIGSWRIYPDFENSTVPREALNRVRHGYVSVVGIFQYRNMKITKGKEFDYIVPGFGWMNIYDKQITKITAFANVTAPKR